MNHNFPFILSILTLGVFPCSSYMQLSQDLHHAWDQSMARLLDLAQEAQARLIASQPALSVEEDTEGYHQGQCQAGPGGDGQIYEPGP